MAKERPASVKLPQREGYEQRRLHLLTALVPTPTLAGMEIHFSPDKEARLQQVATRTGRDPAQLVEEAVDRMLDYDERFIAAVEEGRASARRGDLLEHEEVVQRVEQMFRW